MPELNRACTERCEQDVLDCISKCTTDDSICLSHCIRQNTECNNGIKTRTIIETKTRIFRLSLWPKLSRWLRWLSKSCLRMSGYYQNHRWKDMTSNLKCRFRNGFENGQTWDTFVRSSLTQTKMTFSKKLQVVENNAEWLRCMDYNSSRLGKCIYECENDKQCEDECVDSFKILQKDCPCEVSSWRCILN